MGQELGPWEMLGLVFAFIIGALILVFLFFVLLKLIDKLLD